MNATPQPQYWIASGGTIIAGPSPIQTIARQRLDGIFPSGTVICQEGTEEWMPLTAGVVESIARKQALIEPAPAPAADIRAAITGSDVANFISVMLIIAGIIGAIASMAADVSVPKSDVANLYAMHRVQMWLLISLASILSGTLILTRGKYYRK